MTSYAINHGLVEERGYSPAELYPFVDRVLADFGLLGAFQSLPSHQQEAYLAALTSARRPEIRQGRIADMLDELAGMAWATDGRPTAVDFATPRSTYH